jgi:hypothetical protein
MGASLRPLTPALSRWESEQCTKVSVVSEKPYPCEPQGMRAEEETALHGLTIPT